MADAASAFALFRVAAGPRLGFGHLRRATVLADLLPRPCALSIRGAAVVHAPWRKALPTPAEALAAAQPRLLVIDDPRAVYARPWLNAARRAGIPCASLHDLGLGLVASDLAVDGSLVTRRPGAARTKLEGPAFSVVGLSGRPKRRRSVGPHVDRIVVSLGGGAHPRLLRALVTALRAALPAARLVIPAGFQAGGLRGVDGSGVDVVSAPHGLAGVLASADLAILGGGVTLYEAAALGTPVVAIAVVPAQQPTVGAFVREGLAVTVAPTSDHVALSLRVARRARALADDRAARQGMRQRGPATIDGQGARRVAGAFLRLAETGRA